MGLEQLEKSWLSCVLLPIYASNLGQLFQNENITDDNIVLESVYKDMPVNFLDGLTYLIRRASITFFYFFYPIQSILLGSKILLLSRKTA